LGFNGSLKGSIDEPSSHSEKMICFAKIKIRRGKYMHRQGHKVHFFSLGQGTEAANFLEQSHPTPAVNLLLSSSVDSESKLHFVAPNSIIPLLSQESPAPHPKAMSRKERYIAS
jgi:hypothetical protein